MSEYDEQGLDGTTTPDTILAAFDADGVIDQADEAEEEDEVEEDTDEPADLL
ncbi:MAG: hypothetical protein JWN18_705 [Parcubacteria group bacterium]|nr:hypothetical protein [Parcubacteria group bacterium]